MRHVKVLLGSVDCAAAVTNSVVALNGHSDGAVKDVSNPFCAQVAACSLLCNQMTPFCIAH